MKVTCRVDTSNHNWFYWVYEDEDLVNISHGPVNDDNTDDSSSEYGMLNPYLLDLDLPMQGNVESVTGPFSSTVEDICSTGRILCILLTT